MFDLTTVWLMMLVVLVIQAFWQLRRFGEVAERNAKQYCQRHHLQLLSVPRKGLRLAFNKGLQIEATYTLNYSADGLTAKQGEVILTNGKVSQISHWS